MSHKTYNTVSTKATPQSQRIMGTKQVKNSAGGYSWTLDSWGMLDRFLILGSEGGTYYASERKLTADSASNVMKCVGDDGLRVVRRVLEVSKEGRAPKNDPAILVLAMCAKLGDDITRKAAFEVLPEVCRIGTHLFHFIQYAENMGGWGRAQRRAIANWYNEKDPKNLMYQLIKYQQRDGWSNRDALRLSHPTPASDIHQAIFQWVTQGTMSDKLDGSLIWAAEEAKKVESVKDICCLVKDFGLPREALPTEWLNHKEVWEVLLEGMPMTALIRNLAKMTSIGVLGPMNSWTKLVVSRLENTDYLAKARIHPIAVLSALRTYQGGHGVMGKLTWKPVQMIVDALDSAFYHTFKFVEPTGKNIVLALDVSGSMGAGLVAGVPGLTPRDASAAMAKITLGTEKNVVTVGFTSSRAQHPLYLSPRRQREQIVDDGISVLNLSAKDSLDTTIRKVSSLPFGGTDCALPMLWAMKNKVEADAFVIYTDNESWAGEIHVSQALEMYRKQTGIRAKLIPVGLTATQFTVGDPNDAGTLNVVGFDTAAPQIMSDFIRG